MSEMAEMDQMISKPRPGSVPLSILIEFICQKMYTDLMRLVDLLPSKTDLEKKIEIATFFSRTRHLFIRLEALVKWSNNASKVDKCEKISNFLEEQSFFLINTANSLSRLLRETLVGARLPPFAVLHAIDIFTNKTYTRLPKSIKNYASSVDAVSDKEASQALLDLNRIIQNRLSLTQLPRQFKIIKINNGRVHFVVPHEFCVTMTLMSEAVDFPWRILAIKFLIRDPVANFQSLVHPAQVQFIHSQAQSRLLYRHFDKRPPLIHLYDMLRILLYAFSISLQLDVLHEQAQRARATRPIDQLIVEAYRPGHSLVLSYWHALSRNHFQAQLGLDGKLQSTAYMLTIHVDPVDPQRPLCISHRPELPATESHRIGSVLQGNCLSIERLLTRTITARAEQILHELRQELMVLSPGPVNLADAPLCLYVPLLWPCHPQEYLQFRVDPIQGTLGASCPFLLTSDAEQILLGSAVPTQTGPVASVEGYSRASVCAALNSLENALNQPSTRRVCPVSANPGVATGDSSLLLAQTRSLRALSNTESRWRSVLCQSLEHLRLCIGLVRLMKTAKTYRPFWQPAKRSLPLVLTPVQASLVKSGSSWPPALVRFQQSLRFPIVFVQLFPNNEYYVVCEVIPAPLNVRFQYSLIVCAPIPEHMDVTIDAHGLAVSHTSQKLATAGLQPIGSSLFLQVTHLAPLEVASVWFHNPSSSLSLLKSCIEKARSNTLAKRTSRVNALLSRIKGGGGTQTDSSSGFTGDGDVALKSNHSIVPSLSRLIGTLEENILSNCLALELSRAGITHEGVQHDADGCLSAIRLLSLPSRPLVWQPVNLVSLSDYVRQIVLRPHFDPSTHRRSWQLDLLFSGIGPAHSLNSVPVVQQKLRHQTAEWFVVRLEDYATLVKNVLAEWDCLCAMHALCYQVVTTPGKHRIVC
ncbi:hypothetical protein PHET_05453 [Paragonimus heterotremus]|uniref:Mediator of RNA polymerase II transcription subunit 14 n=1 Tax=Paragonimus heterotremus TaxID=100268 RepID=A0A8J4T0D0_9TREM|nr:hypothetical protein PHET_05453 [Paragonimus heterotremus]